MYSTTRLLEWCYNVLVNATYAKASWRRPTHILRLSTGSSEYDFVINRDLYVIDLLRATVLLIKLALYRTPVGLAVL